MKGLIFIYAMTLFGVIGSFVDPLIGLFTYVLFAVLRPTYLWGYFGDLGGISQYVGIAMLICWAIRGGGNWKIGRGRPIVAMLLAFLAWAAISSVFALNSRIGFDWVIEMTKVAMPFLVGVTMLDDRKHLRWMIWMIVITQAYLGWVMNSAYFFDAYNRANENGYGGMDGNSFAISLVATLGPTLALILVAKKWPVKIGMAFGSVLILHTVLLTFSRGAMVGLLVSGVASFFILPKRPSYLFVLLVAGIILIRLTGPQLLMRYQSTFAEADERDPSAQSRFELWNACFQIAKEHPLVGVGTRNFPLVAQQYGFTAGKEAHSVWMQTMAEMGIPGVSFLALFYLVTIFKLWPLARAKLTDENREEKILSIGLIVGIVGFMVSAQFVSLTGLELPYYLVMVAVSLMKTSKVKAGHAASAAAAVPSFYGAAPAPASVSYQRNVSPRSAQ